MRVVGGSDGRVVTDPKWLPIIYEYSSECTIEQRVVVVGGLHVGAAAGMCGEANSPLGVVAEDAGHDGVCGRGGVCWVCASCGKCVGLGVCAAILGGRLQWAEDVSAEGK